MPSSELSGVFCYVYIMYSDVSKQFYVGYTQDLKSRFAKHNIGLNFSTKPYVPWELIYYEAHKSEADAKRRGKYLKTTAGDRALHKMLRQQITDIRNLSHQKVYY